MNPVDGAIPSEREGLIMETKIGDEIRLLLFIIGLIGLGIAMGVAPTLIGDIV